MKRADPTKKSRTGRSYDSAITTAIQWNKDHRQIHNQRTLNYYYKNKEQINQRIRMKKELQKLITSMFNYAEAMEL